MNVRRQFKKRINEKQNLITPIPAVVGDDYGNVYDSNQNIYVRIAGQVQKVKATDISPLYNQKVWVGYEPTQPNTFKILNERTGSGQSNILAPKKHAHTHEWMGHGVGGGTDVVKVQLGQFMPLRVMAYSEFTLMVYPGLIRAADSFILLADTNDSGKPIPKTFSVEEHSYVDDGKSAYVLVTIDTSGEIITTKGDEVDTESLALTDIPSIPEGTQYVLAAVRLYSGITEIQENREATDIVDLRFPMAHYHEDGDLPGITNLIDETIDLRVTTEGDILYGEATEIDNTNWATVANGASATAISTWEGNVAGRAIDENDATWWAGATFPVTDDWIKIDLGQVRTITHFRILQPYLGTTGAPTYKVRVSDDNSTWTDILNVTATANDETIWFDTPKTYRYFQFYALSGGIYSWQIWSLELLERIVIQVDLKRLPIGTKGQHLVVDTGLPKWENQDHDAEKIDGIEVDLSTISDGNALVYDAYTGQILPGAGGGGASALSDLTDVDLTDLADGDVLVYDSTSEDWLPETPASGGSLTVEEADGTPSVDNVSKIKVTNGTLTDDGSGVVSIDFGSAATDGSAIHDNVSGEIHAITEETTPASVDEIIVESAANGYAKRKVKIGNIPSGMTNPMTTVGDIIYGGASGTPERLEAGTEGQVLTMGATNPEWAEATGEGSGYTTPPSSGWSWVNQGTGTVEDNTDGSIYLYAPALAGDNARIRARSIPTAPFTLDVCLWLYQAKADFNQAGILVRESSTGKFISFTNTHINSAGGFTFEVNAYNSPTSFNSNYVRRVIFPINPVYLRIEDDSTNRIYSYSGNGVNFIRLYSHARTKFCTPDEIGIMTQPINGSYPSALVLLSWKES